MKKYGTRAWIESQYCASEEDPWGLNWRPSQKYRYVRMFDALNSTMAATSRPNPPDLSAQIYFQISLKFA